MGVTPLPVEVRVLQKLSLHVDSMPKTTTVPVPRVVKKEGDTNHLRYGSGSQPVVRGPLMVRDHLPGGPQARPNIYLILR